VSTCERTADREQVKGVQLANGEAAESFDHLVAPEEAIRIAMARQ
jgi:hypothetical protein